MFVCDCLNLLVYILLLRERRGGKWDEGLVMKRRETEGPEWVLQEIIFVVNRVNGGS